VDRTFFLLEAAALDSTLVIDFLDAGLFVPSTFAGFLA
jgi:hypothetical protein